MKKRLMGILALVAASAIILAGCGSSAQSYSGAQKDLASQASMKNISGEVGAAMASTSEVMETEMAVGDAYYEDDEEPMTELPNMGGGGGDSSIPDPPANKRKLIITTSLDLETKAFDDAIKSIPALVEASGGYMESSNFNGVSLLSADYARGYAGEYSSYYTPPQRYAYFSMRIPSAGSDSVIAKLNEDFHVISSSESTQDVSASYFDLDAKMTTLVERQERLEALLDNDGDLEYLLEVEREIGQVKYEINSLYSQIQNIDSLVDYSTINVSLREVVDYQPTEALDDSFMTRLQRDVSRSWKDLWYGVQNFAIWIVAVLPVLILLGVIAFIVVLIVRKKSKQIHGKITQAPLVGPTDYEPTQPTQADVQQETPKDKKE